MGQAAVDLPDPLAKAPAPATNADDLLSQLAGEEIDRLMAGADHDAPTEPQRTVQVFSADGEVKQATLPADAPLTAADHAKIDEVLNAAQAESAASVAPDAPVASNLALESETSPAERTALEGVTDALKEKAVVAATNPVAIASNAPNELPIFLKPLQWISMPLMLFPAGIRDLVGKIAIVTLFNAIAVLIYVLMFRVGH